MIPRSRLVLAVAGALLVAGGAVAFAIPADRTDGTHAATPPVSAAEHARTIAAMRPPKRERPVVAVLGHNDGTETTDYLIPYAVLRQSDAADVVAVSLRDGPMAMTPALTIRAEATLAEFDRRHADGADYVIVAAMHPRDDPAILRWIVEQEAKGAIIVGVCSGVRTLSAAGLLENRRATRYWYDADDLAEASPTTRWVSNRRYVVDGSIVTTTGISASMPISLALVEAIAGRDRARATADHFGVADWDEHHAGDRFGFDRRMLAAALANKLSLWSHEEIAIPVADGVDEVSLAFDADAWSRTFRSSVAAVSAEEGAITTRFGLRLLPDRSGNTATFDLSLPPPRTSQPGRALAANLDDIAGRYGADTATFVAVQLEYPWEPGAEASRIR